MLALARATAAGLGARGLGLGLGDFSFSSRSFLMLAFVVTIFFMKLVTIFLSIAAFREGDTFFLAAARFLADWG